MRSTKEVHNDEQAKIFQNVNVNDHSIQKEKLQKINRKLSNMASQVADLSS